MNHPYLDLTQQPYSGMGPNRTIQHMMDQSMLIYIYRACQILIEGEWLVSPGTSRHAPPPIDDDLQKMMDDMREKRIHSFSPGRTIAEQAIVLNNVIKGMAILQQRGHWEVSEEEQKEDNDEDAAYEVTIDDLV